jgi:hypothetical protein
VLSLAADDSNEPFFRIEQDRVLCVAVDSEMRVQGSADSGSLEPTTMSKIDRRIQASVGFYVNICEAILSRDARL